MSQPTTKQFLQSLADHLTSQATAQTVYGEPVVHADKTVIPVASVLMGFGGGFGESLADPSSALPLNEGGGGGGALRVKPQGFIEITSERTRYVSISRRRYVAVGVAIGLVLGGLWRR